MSSLIDIYLNYLFYFLYCNVCNFADNTTPYVCNKNLEFVFTKLENHSDVAIKWLEDNYMKIISVKYVTFLSLVTNLSIYGLKLVMIKFEKQELLNF